MFIMKSRLLLFIVFLPLVMSSCQQEKPLGDNELPDLAKVQSLTPIDSIDLESRGILDPFIIRFCDDFLIFQNNSGMEELYFLDLHDMSVAEKVVKGQGPDEVGSYYDLVLGKSKNSIN